MESASVPSSSGRANPVLYFLYQIYKWLVYGPILAVTTSVGAFIVVLICRFNPRLASRVIARNWARLNTYTVPANIEVVGRENFQPDVSYVVVANHISQFDILALYGWLNLDLKWVMKEELRKAPFLGFAAAALGHVFINRRNPTAAIERLNQIKDELQPGASPIIFPEGTRRNAGSLGQFKRGAFIMAKNLNLPILPVTLVGTDKIVPPGSLDLFPGKASIHVHPPIDVSNASVQELRLSTRAAIASVLESADLGE